MISRIVQLILILVLTSFAGKSWSYSYGVFLGFPDNEIAQFEAEKYQYDTTSNPIRFREQLPFYFYERAQVGSFFASDLGLVTTKGTALVPKAIVPLGKWSETRLAQVLGNAGTKPRGAFTTSLGKRFVDRLVNGVAHEAKAGLNVKLSSSIRKQVLKDVDLLNSGQIRGSHWHFFQGADSKLLNFLGQNGIKYTVH